jgi:site-specific DNA-methyltransferase (adenine-specific)
MIELLNVDCMEYMATLPGKAFDLAIVDPPYGIGKKLTQGGGGAGLRNMCESGADKWDIKPKKQYFDEMFRVSKNQIIWGANYFFEEINKSSRGFVYWDKEKPVPNFSAGEFAWTSFDTPSKIFRHMYTNVAGLDLCKIHPTQKPIKLYDWLLKNYANPGQRILDTHLGSGSSAIAAHYFGCDFVGCELDPDYYRAATERFDRETRQQAFEI